MSDDTAARPRGTGPSRRDGACAVLSQRSAEPLSGTASLTTRWLMVEHPGPWPSAAVESALDPELLTAIRDRAPDVRLALIRRPDVRSVTAPTVFMVALSSTPWMRRVTLDSYADLLGLDLPGLARGERPHDGVAVTSPVFFVCTHGKREICCAEFGRPVLRALHEAEVPVWEVTHIGGDRFAASMVAFPHGYYFGHLNPQTGLVAAQRLLGGQVDIRHTRGRGGQPASAQVAELHLREHLDRYGTEDVAVSDVTESGDAATVDLMSHGTGYRVALQAHLHDEPVLNGCIAGISIERRTWRPLSVTEAETARFLD